MSKVNWKEYLYTDHLEGANIAPEDFKRALPHLKRIKPKVIVEIGTYLGGSARLWQALFKPDVLITIDRKKLASDLEDCLYLHEHLSKDPRTVAAVIDFLDGTPIDLLFLDGGHLYDDVKADFELYSPLVRHGGLVLFHDIYNDNPGAVEVPRYWQELKASRDYVEIEQTDNSSGLGIVKI